MNQFEIKNTCMVPIAANQKKNKKNKNKKLKIKLEELKK